MCLLTDACNKTIFAKGQGECGTFHLWKVLIKWARSHCSNSHWTDHCSTIFHCFQWGRLYLQPHCLMWCSALRTVPVSVLLPCGIVVTPSSYEAWHGIAMHFCLGFPVSTSRMWCTPIWSMVHRVCFALLPVHDPNYQIAVERPAFRVVVRVAAVPQTPIFFLILWC